ncbi:hypothetical protein PC9H_005850 [Pleurotus ostreatus]|uniref:F-box domain-containing protein n=1 Tax=Pleurotus ostreatus TaxID=5322 RepID=A0A8H6ZVL2_PLEOS|nr:uncharacterized protein PC9H_005850 [Pleurotus ostreatus]KAF7430150.1 hypothetical protein PC9H_005850 [Pleurotus ostreatus]
MFSDSESESEYGVSKPHPNPELTHRDYLDTPSNCTAQNLIEAEIAAHEAAILQLKVRRNAYSPISKLPAEILAKLFILVRRSFSDFGDFPGGLNVATVCHSWREVFVSTTQLWDDLDLSKIKSQDCAELMLARSKQGALHIQWTRPLLDRSVLSAVSSQILRIQDLDICGQSLAILDFFPSKNRALPEMQRLALRRQVRATDAPPISMERVLSMDMPRLHTLELQNIYLPSIRVFQPSPCLQTLHITTPKRLLSLPDILTVLRATPTLHDLTLTHALFLTPPSPSAREDPKYALVDLAQLTSLSVSCNHFRDIALLLQHVRYPCSARVLLRSVTFPHEAGLTEPGCLEVLTAVLSRWAQSTSAGLADRMWLLNKFAWDFKIGVALGEVPLLDIHCEEGGSRDQLRHLFHLHTLLPSRCVRILHISGFGAIEHPEEWKELFVRNHQVQRLVLETQEHPRIIQTLTDQSDTSILPQLKSLMLIRCCFDGHRSDRRFTPRVSELLQQRIDQTPLKIFKIRNCVIEPATVRSLRNIIHVDWDQFLP